MSERSRALNALIGAAVTVVLTFIPFSSVLGGGVAGYLEGGSFGEGARVGALSGLFATVPVLVLFFFVGSVMTFGVIGMGGGRMAGALGGFLLLAVVFSLLYLVALSALGGGVGAAVKGETETDSAAG